MQRALFIFGLIVVFICFPADNSPAKPVKLLGMSSSDRESMSRISFVFDRLPEFEVENSGQRVLVLLEGTRFAESFEKIPGGQILASVKTRKKSSQSVVELYFHNMPEFLDVHYDQAYDRLDLLVFWDKAGLAGRPSILAQGLGKLKPDEAGAFAQQVISSGYKGHWIDFFQEFEWPAELSLPVHFSFPGFPSPLVRQYLEYLPDGFIKEGNSRSWTRAAERLRDLLARHSESPQANLYRLLLAECLLRNKKYSRTEAVLGQVQTNSGNDAAIRGWKAYFLAQAKALAGRPYQADTLLKEQEKTFLGVDGLSPWYVLLQAELALAVDKKKSAFKLLNREKEGPAFPFRLYALREADAQYEFGRLDQATALYQKVASDLRLLQEHPHSLAKLSRSIYQRKQYAKASRYYFLLSETLKKEYPDKRPLADYWSAMARLRAGERTLARLMLWELDEEEAGREAGYRAWLKLLDLDLLEEAKSDLDRIVSEYDRIIELGPTS